MSVNLKREAVNTKVARCVTVLVFKPTCFSLKSIPDSVLTHLINMKFIQVRCSIGYSHVGIGDSTFINMGISEDLGSNCWINVHNNANSPNTQGVLIQHQRKVTNSKQPRINTYSEVLIQHQLKVTNSKQTPESTQHITYSTNSNHPNQHNSRSINTTLTTLKTANTYSRSIPTQNHQLNTYSRIITITPTQSTQLKTATHQGVST
ncbi:9769_t:CDS:2 [Funneliformis geosporum]|uniref:9769_t:CDS:1 n=1 Tax=Funneliformis geosporum TaxID=1117311 RepID=A0A9W4SZ14_9GLOM|nr:9769_t:CDS:2 [Funneliformis geosporum]